MKIGGTPPLPLHSVFKGERGVPFHPGVEEAHAKQAAAAQAAAHVEPEDKPLKVEKVSISAETGEQEERAAQEERLQRAIAEAAYHRARLGLDEV